MSDTLSSPSGSVSRNSLFSTSWTSDIRPPRPLSTAELPSSPVSKLNTSPTQLSPLSISRASSLRRNGHTITGLGHPAARNRSPLGGRSQEVEPFSPLHQSPSLLAVSDQASGWRPPQPPITDDIDLRFVPNANNLLGHGRYAKVYRAACRPRRSDLNAPTETPWQDCAAKQLAPDRDSQTLGLREAFFLNRLARDGPQTSPQTDSDWENSMTATRPASTRPSHNSLLAGRVFVIKLIAVKEDVEDGRRVAHHARAVSEATVDGRQAQSQNVLTRQRSSTLLNRLPLGVSPSLPSMKGNSESTPALSRLLLLLEYAPNGTLDRFIRTRPHLIGEHLWKRWARQAAEALRWVHSRGVLHADVKPGNLLLSEDLDLRLSDFGSSLLIHPSQPPSDGLGLGTLPFSAPELVDSSRSFALPVDIFALGATLYQCLTGLEPYRGNRAVEMMHYVRQGSLWTYEERARVARIDVDLDEFINTSPFPSAWRADGHIDDRQPRRAGSLRLASSSARRPYFETINFNDPHGAVALGSKETDKDNSTSLFSRDPLGAPLELAPSALNRAPGIESVSRDTSVERSAYPDGSPVMYYLDGRHTVSEDIRAVLKDMVAVDPEDRPTAEELVELWEAIRLDTKQE